MDEAEVNAVPILEVLLDGLTEGREVVAWAESCEPSHGLREENRRIGGERPRAEEREVERDLPPSAKQGDGMELGFENGFWRCGP